MSAVGIVGIVMGLLVVIGRGAPLMVAPATYLRWFRGLIRTNNTTRMFGALLLILCAAMAWAGATDDSTLANLLTGGGIAGVAGAGAALQARTLHPRRVDVLRGGRRT